MTTRDIFTRSLASLLALTACKFVAEGEPGSDSSSSSDDDGDSVSTTATATGPTSAGSHSATTAGSSDDESSDGSSDSSGTFGDDATTTHGESSTGEAVTDWALAFDGTSHARKVDESAVQWTATDYTVEAWVRIDDVDDARGVILDATNVAFTSGWVLYLHNDWHALVFSSFDEIHQNQVVTGPAIAEIGTGWHHVAATKSGGSVSLYVDGVEETVQSVSAQISFDDASPWTLGGNAVDNPDFRLTKAAIDDVRISDAARYEGDFDPPVSYDADDDSVILLLRIDESDGVVLSDDAGQVDFSVSNPSWVPGNTE